MSTHTTVPRYDHLCSTRRLVLVDIENAASGATMTIEHVKLLRSEINELLRLTPWDQVIVGCSHFALLNAKLGWPDARFVVRSGPDGADLMLLAELGHADPGRYGALVLVSGDHLFAPAVAAAVLPTTVLSHRSSLSAELKLAAMNALYLSSMRSDAA